MFKKVLKVIITFIVSIALGLSIKKIIYFVFSVFFLDLIMETNTPLARISSTHISVRRTTQKAPIKNNVVIKKETISGSRLTCIRKSVHRVERMSSKMLLQQQQQQSTSELQQQNEEQILNQDQIPGNFGVDDEEYNSDDIFDPEKADIGLLKLAKVIIFLFLLFTEILNTNIFSENVT
jgi:hypothetical protein